ncbi:hypothetical protein Tco_0213300 [Tanacetum coccineum]
MSYFIRYSSVFNDSFEDVLENDNVPVNNKHKLQHDVVVGSVWDVVNDVCLTINEDNVKEKSVGKGKKSTILKQNATSDISKDKPKNNVPKKNSRDVKNSWDVKEKWKSVVEKSTVKSKAKPEVKSKAKPEVKSKADVKRKRILSKDDEIDSSSVDVSDRKPKKIKSKAELKRKRNGGSDSDSSSVRK